MGLESCSQREHFCSFFLAKIYKRFTQFCLIGINLQSRGATGCKNQVMGSVAQWLGHSNATDKGGVQNTNQIKVQKSHTRLPDPRRNPGARSKSKSELKFKSQRPNYQIQGRIQKPESRNRVSRVRKPESTGSKNRPSEGLLAGL